MTNNTVTHECKDVEQERTWMFKPRRMSQTIFFYIWLHAVNHSRWWCRNAVVWPSHQRRRSPFRAGSELISIPTVQQLSGDELEITSHWFLASELQSIGWLTLMAEVIMTNVKVRPADFSGQTFPHSCHHNTPECETSTCVSGGRWPPGMLVGQDAEWNYSLENTKVAVSSVG